MGSSVFQKKRLLLTIGILFVISIIFIFITLKHLDQQHSKTHQEHENLLLQEAISLFDTMIRVRQWNAGHGGIYVKQKDGIVPNPYLIDNVLYTDDNATLIKVNPAWMTRQVSEIINEGSQGYYHLTSLQPLNPINSPDDFEVEALKYFEKNADEKYYHQNVNSIDADNISDVYNFMGRLDTKDACLKCHEVQGYKTGDLRGGLRISIPTAKIKKLVETEDISYASNRLLFISLLGLLLTMVCLVVYLFFKEQSKLNKFNLMLEKTVDERTRELNELNANLEQEISKEVMKSKEKDQLIITQSRQAAMGEMISMIAHQWRQPISAIAMDASNMMIDIELDNIDKTEFKEYTEGIIEQTDHLSNTIDDFKNFFRDQKTKEKLLPSKVVQECIKIVGASLKSHGISHETVCVSEEEISVLSRELLQVLLNLVNNAKDILIEHKTENAHIIIKTENINGTTIIKVCDNGVGIAEDVLPKIFDPYFTTKEAKDGTGLGLYMSKMIIHTNLKGKLYVTREENQTCFVIELS